MVKVIGVRFRQAGKIYNFDPLDFKIEVGNHVIVETARGLEFGTVTMGETEVKEQDLVAPLKSCTECAGKKRRRRYYAS